MKFESIEPEVVNKKTASRVQTSEKEQYKLTPAIYLERLKNIIQLIETTGLPFDYNRLLYEICELMFGGV